MDYKSKSDTLLYHSNLSADTVFNMKRMRKLFFLTGQCIEKLGSTRELSEAFTHLETAQMYVMKALCMLDDNAVLEPLDPDDSFPVM
jgi:hypothetical protein